MMDLALCRQKVERAMTGWRWHPDWEDLCQEAVINVWKHDARLKGSVPWRALIKIGCRNAIVHWTRSHRCRQYHSRYASTAPVKELLLLDLTEHEEYLLPHGDPTEAIINRIAARQQTIVALAAMTRRQRRIVLLSFWGEVPINEIARHLGVSYRTAWLSRERGLRRARRALSGAPKPSTRPHRITPRCPDCHRFMAAAHACQRKDEEACHAGSHRSDTHP